MREVQPTLPPLARDDGVQTIAEQIGETEPASLQLLSKVVIKLNSEQALTFLKEMQEVEARGGLILPDGSRRRTPGGVFLSLVRTKCPVQVRFLFWHHKPEQGTASLQGEQPAFTWAERRAVLDEIGAMKGAVSPVKTTVIGRPSKVIDHGTCVVMSMPSTKAPSCPRASPHQRIHRPLSRSPLRGSHGDGLPRRSLTRRTHSWGKGSSAGEQDRQSCRLRDNSHDKEAPDGATAHTDARVRPRQKKRGARK